MRGNMHGRLIFSAEDLPAHFAVWAATPEAEFLHGRFAWASWDVEEMKSGDVFKSVQADTDFLTLGFRRESPGYEGSSSPRSNVVAPVVGGRVECETRFGLTTENPFSSGGFGFHPLKFHALSRVQPDDFCEALEADAEAGRGCLAVIASGGGGRA
ncbi:hypothetical protein NM208_g6044 [Fusarium decemcellulare]|uniref:Uncharacterized protein n=1 Tax=Fusarium decemcellulare TaxID=57161 RepID=A0ACC1SEW5_9HYPO|nr:hypothetical protein NM208_g6044 [Fusarium decemcellulare]